MFFKRRSFKKCLHNYVLFMHISHRLTMWGLPNIGRQCCLVQGFTFQVRGRLMRTEISDIVFVRAEIFIFLSKSGPRDWQSWIRPVLDILILTGLSSLYSWFSHPQSINCTAKFIIWISMWFAMLLLCNFCNNSWGYSEYHFLWCRWWFMLGAVCF